MTEIIESFTIPITEWKTVDAGKNTIRIKGVALKGNVVSKNDRLYVAKELRKATNTFIGKPVNIHHNDPNNERTNIGDITWMDWDDTAELLTYEAEITKRPYVDMLRNKSTEIRGVSIQAKFLHNRCPDCQEKFYQEEPFRNHMWTEHFKKVSAVPHGIIGEALTLVLSPEIPGYSGTTVDIAEIARVQTLRLLETVIKTEKEKEEYNMSKINAGVTPRKEIAVGSVAEIKQPEKPKMEAPIKSESVTPTQIAQKELVVMATPAPIPEVAPVIKEVVVKPAETITLKESKLVGINEIVATKLSLGEPFAEYENFAACVTANQDKDNPEAYCGKIKHEVEEILSLRLNVKQLTHKLNELMQEQNKPITLTMPEVKIPAPYDDKAIRETIAVIPKDDLGWKEIKPYDDTQIKEVAAKTNIDLIDFGLSLGKLKQETQETLKELPTIKEAMTQQKKDFDTLLDSADKSVKEYFAQAKKDAETDKTKIKELEEKLKTAETKKLEETQKLETRVDNLEDKLQPQFKGKSKGTGTTDNKPVLEDPMKQKEKSQ